MNKKLSTRIAVVCIATLLTLLTACSSVDPEIVGVTANDGFVDGDYAIQVDCTYKNSGGEGTIDAWSTLTGGGIWVESQTISLGKGETQLVRFVFTGPTFFGAGLSGFKYNCGYGDRPESRPAPQATATSIAAQPKATATRIPPTSVVLSPTDILGRWQLVSSNNFLLVDNQIMEFRRDGSISVEAAGLFGPISESGEYTYNPDGSVHIRVVDEFGFAYHDFDYKVSISGNAMSLSTFGGYLLKWTRIE